MRELIGDIAVLFIILKICWSLLNGFYTTFLASMLGMSCNFKTLGKWAVVTGATDGIGKAYALEMARCGLNVVLISRNMIKLQNVAEEIMEKYRVETKIIDVDFTQTNIYERIEKELANLEIGVLINNVAMNYEYPEYFVNITDDFIHNIINCNIVSVTKMCKIVLPEMQRRKKGLVINITSFYARIPSPLLAVYGATKCYVVKFTECLLDEMKPFGIIVQDVHPVLVASNMTKAQFPQPTLLVPTPTRFVRSSLKTAGVENSTGGYFWHKLQIYGAAILTTYAPHFIVSKMALSVMQKRILAYKQNVKKYS